VIAVEGSTVVLCAPDAVIDFVTDLERYKQADTKITRVHSSNIRGDHGEVRYSGKLRGIPGPAMVNVVVIDRPRRVDYSSKRGTWQHTLMHFHGSFVLEPAAGGTRVVHREEFEFAPPLAWIVDPLLRSSLAKEMDGEIARLKELLEASSGQVEGAT
jgi:carbon monoxide dehydrogenase subunit G